MSKNQSSQGKKSPPPERLGEAAPKSYSHVEGANGPPERDQWRSSLGEQVEHLATALGSVIKYWRTQQGMVDQKDLVDRLLVVKQSQLSEIETGKRPPKLEALLDISKALNLSLSTLFHDAETAGPGGLFFRSYSRLNDSYDAKLGYSVLEKRWMAEYVAFALQQEYERQTIGIDGGTTNEFVGQAIGRQVVAKQLTVSTIVTNHLCIPEAVSMTGTPPHVHLTGGRYRPERKTLIGREVVEAIEQYPLKASVIGANGIDYPNLYTGGGSEDDLKLAFMRQAREVIIPLDPSKWGSQTAAKPLVSVEGLLGEPKKKIVSLITVYPANLRHRPHSGRGNRFEFDKVLESGGKILAGKTPCTLDFTRVSLPPFHDKPLVLQPHRVSNAALADLQKACREIDSEDETETGLVIRFRLENDR